MSYLNIHTRSLHSFTDKPGRPWKRKRRTTWYKKNLRKKDWSKDKSTVKPNEQDIVRWQEVLVQYSEAFDDICNAFYAGYYSDDYFVPKSWAGRVIFDKMKALETFCPARDLEKDDIENRLRYIWYQSVARYNQRKHLNIPFYNYLFRISLFELSSWRKSMKPVYVEINTSTGIPKEESLTLRWLLLEENSFNLTAYERILLYFRCAENMTYENIAKKVGRSKPAILNEFDRLKNKLHSCLLS